MEERRGRGGIYHKAIFESQMGSSLEVPQVLKKVGTHLSPNPIPPVRPGLADFVCCFCCYSHFLWDHFKSLLPDGPTSFCNQLAGGEACQNLR